MLKIKNFALYRTVSKLGVYCIIIQKQYLDLSVCKFRILDNDWATIPGFSATWNEGNIDSPVCLQLMSEILVDFSFGGGLSLYLMVFLCIWEGEKRNSLSTSLIGTEPCDFNFFWDIPPDVTKVWVKTSGSHARLHLIATLQGQIRGFIYLLTKYKWPPTLPTGESGHLSLRYRQEAKLSPFFSSTEDIKAAIARSGNKDILSAMTFFSPWCQGSK